MADRINADVILMFLPFTGLVFINLLVTTWADKEADTIVGKFTLATRLNQHQLMAIYATVAVLSYSVLLLLMNHILPIQIVMGCLLTIPLGMWGYRAYTQIHSPHPTIYAMIAMLIVYVLGWLSAIV